MLNRKGFTLIELLIVVVIIGILAAIAIPKFAATKDKAKLASVRADVRNYMTSQEAYFSDFSTYAATAAALGASWSPSAGNLPEAEAGDAAGYAVTVRNASISTGSPNECHVTVGSGGAGVDGVIICATPTAP